MPSMQAISWAITLFSVTLLAAGQARPQTQPHFSQAGERLATECDRLLRLAVQRPYGWGWPGPPTDNSPAAPPAKTPVGFTPLSTPAAGLILYWAGRELNQPRYQQAAGQAARGIATAQETTGRIPTAAIFATQPINQDRPQSIPDRRATTACLGFLLAMLDEDAGNAGTIRRTAARATQWLMRQQTPSGVWPIAIEHQSGDDPPRQVRIVRLDNPDYRDCTLALLLATEVLPDRFLLRNTERASAALSRMALNTSHTAKGLWLAAYEVDGTPSTKLPQAMDQIDMPACRYSMQTLLATYLMSEDGPSLVWLQTATTSLATLRYEDGVWQYRYPLLHNELPAITKGPAPRDEMPFASAKSAPASIPSTGEFGLPGVLRTASELKTAGRAALQTRLSACYSPKQDISRTLLGLIDDPMSLELPGNAVQAKQYLASHPDWVNATDLSIENEPTAIIQRAARFLLVMRLEQLAGTP